MQTLTVDIEINKVPSVARLITAVDNVVKPLSDGTYCTCVMAIDHPMVKVHAPTCIELSEAIKQIKEKS